MGEALTKSTKSRASFGGAILNAVDDIERLIDAIVEALIAILCGRRMREVNRRADSIEWEGRWRRRSHVRCFGCHGI